jgi:hypothetical protein
VVIDAATGEPENVPALPASPELLAELFEVRPILDAPTLPTSVPFDTAVLFDLIKARQTLFSFGYSKSNQREDVLSDPGRSLRSSAIREVP